MKHTGYTPSKEMHTPKIARGHGRGIRNSRVHTKKPACLEPSCELNGARGGTSHTYAGDADHTTTPRHTRGKLVAV